ncbi:MAG: hypothetical protein GX949_03725 [Peptococcaceae bacterium]|jgi:hypothetical protein|nr:hypothetical protein [Peptococcaceae bacterium]
MEEGNRQLNTLSRRIALLAENMEKMKLAEYVKLLDNPWRLLYVNFIAGLARGLGVAVGFSVLGALLLIVLKRLVLLNLPWIGGIIAEIVQMVQLQIGG